MLATSGGRVPVLVQGSQFAAEAHRQSAAIAATEQDADDQAFVDAISDDWADAGESAE
jgi:hypothetical protein